MTNREKKKILRSYRQIDRQIKSWYDQIDEIVVLLKSPQFDGMPRGSGSTDPTADLVQKKDELFRQINEAIDEKAAALRRIREELSKLSTVEESLLTYRYIDGMNFEQVAEALEYSWRHTLRLHGQALAHFMEGGEDDEGGKTGDTDLRGADSDGRDGGPLPEDPRDVDG